MLSCNILDILYIDYYDSWLSNPQRGKDLRSSSHACISDLWLESMIKLFIPIQAKSNDFSTLGSRFPIADRIKKKQEMKKQGINNIRKSNENAAFHYEWSKLIL